MKHYQIYITVSRNTSILDLAGMNTEKFKLNSQDILSWYRKPIEWEKEI